MADHKFRDFSELYRAAFAEPDPERIELRIRRSEEV